MLFPVRPEDAPCRRAEPGGEIMESRNMQPCVLSLVPGRLRMHVPGLERDNEPEVLGLLRRSQGVQAVEANALTRNLLVRYDPRLIRPERLQELVQQAQQRRPAPGQGAPAGTTRLVRAGLRGLV